MTGGPVALVSGANKGIGLEIARGLGELGFTVAVGARDGARGAAAARALCREGLTAHHLPLDIAGEESVRAAADRIGELFGRLDVLVNNAAVKLESHPAPPSGATLDTVRRTYETNVFGTIAVMLAMLPLLRRSAAARVVNVSSGLGSLGLAARPGSVHARKHMLGYNTSKAALNAVTLQFANELRGTSIKVNAADPGYTSTDMTGNDGSRTAARAARVAIRLATLPADGPTGGFFGEDGPLPW